MSNRFTNTLLLFLLVKYSVTQKLRLPENNPLNTEQLNECQSCRVLTESFNHWLENTSRGKFEGGDAAWEEAKLKSYARSEIRLVEIQEGICSEVKKHQDKCYGLIEDAEPAIERWWFHEDPNSDFHTWLCIETLKHCCPSHHYGEECTVCPVDSKNKICGGHGHCDGDGTRKGTGSCICKKGYSGTFCEECATKYYKDEAESCRPCHKSCDECSGAGPDACARCATGWHLDAGVCVDVDECAQPVSTKCDSNQYCVNLQGSHACKPCHKSCKTCAGVESSSCTSCEPNYVFWSGNCLSDKLKRELVDETFSRLAMYSALLAIFCVILKTSRMSASLLIIIIAYHVYITETKSQMNIIDVGLNILHLK